MLLRFTKAFVLEGLIIILKFNYFYINKNVFHQIKGTAMGTLFVVVGSNLTVTYFEAKMFALLPQIYPGDFLDYFGDYKEKRFIIKWKPPLNINKT